MTLKNSPNAISSPESEVGAEHSNSPGGLTTDRSGQGHVPVNLSPRQAKERGLMTSGTCGLPGSTSLSSLALGLSLENKLQARTDSIGSTLYNLTWKRRATPTGRQIFARRAGVRRTSVSASGLLVKGWPTPTVGNGMGSQLAKNASTTGKRPDGSKATVSLPQVAQAAGWQTPTAPTKTNGHQAGNSNFTTSITEALKIEQAIRVTAAGEVLTGSDAEMTSGGPLNPEHSRWLMGFPEEWTSCAPTETPSFLRSQRTLSAPT